MKSAIDIAHEIFPALGSNRDCHNGTCYDSLWDRHYQCGGCRNCPEQARLAWHAGVVVWMLGNWSERARQEDAVIAARSLAAIGAAIEAALRPGLGLAAFALHIHQTWCQLAVGRWVCITGTRGNARAHVGKIGEVKWIGTQERQSRHGTWSYGSTTRIGLAIEGDPQLLYVNAKHVEPCLPPAHVLSAKAARIAVAEERKARTACLPSYGGGIQGRAKDAAVIVSGEHAGKRGRVFWSGERKGERRLGIKACNCRKRCTCEAMWTRAVDAIAVEPHGLVPLEVNGITIGPDEQAEIIVTALSEAGFDAESRAWADAYARLRVTAVAL